MNDIGKYRILSVLDEGHNVTRYLGSDSGQTVVISQLHPHCAGDSVIRRRFIRESEIALRLKHPNIVRGIELFEVDDIPAIVTEYLESGSLRDRIPLGRSEVVALAGSIADALAYAHSEGVVHRDIRPENIQFDESETANLCGFGMAHVDDLVGLTTSTLLSSTSRYLAPEVLAGNTRDPRSDLYSLGVVLYESCTGVDISQFTSGGLDMSAKAVLFDGACLDPWFGELIEQLVSPIEKRPVSALEVSDCIRRQGVQRTRTERSCIQCKKPTPANLPVCIHCGSEGIYAELATVGEESESLILRKLSEEDEIFGDFLFLLRCLSGNEDLRVNVLTGDIRMYSKAEKAAGYRLPVRILDGLTPNSSALLAKLFERKGSSKIHVYRRATSQLRKREKRGPLIEAIDRPVTDPMDIGIVKKQLQNVKDRKDTPGYEVFHRIVDSGFQLRGALRELGTSDAILDRLLETIDKSTELLHACESTATYLAGVELSRLYTDLCDVERRIATSEDTGEIDRLIASKLDLLTTYDGYREKERRLSASVALLGRIQTAFQRVLERTKKEQERIHDQRNDPNHQSFEAEPSRENIEDILSELCRELVSLLG